MSSPRKFSEKIALLQQKQAEDDAAFHTIIHEVEAAKQIADRGPSAAAKLDVPTRKYPTLNGINHSDNNNQYTPQTIKLEHSNGSDRLLLPPENPSWRRTHSDSSLHQAMMPTVVAQYQAQIDNQDNNQQLDFDIRDVKPEPHAYSTTTHQQYHPHPMQSHAYYDVNNNNNYPHDQSNLFYSTAQQHQQPTAPSPGNHHTHALLGTRFSGGNMNSNVLMLPPNQHPRSGGSLPDLRNGNVYHNHHQPISFAAMPPSPQQYLRSPSPHQNGDGDLYALGPQQQLPSRSGPLKLSPSIRRRHSPIGDGKTSPRRQNSPTRDGSSMPSQNHYRVDTNSPPSLPSYSPQNSPHLLASPATELSPFSPQQQQQQQQTSADNPQHYFTLPNQFDQITLDNKFYTQQQPSPPSVPQNHSLPTTPGATNNLGSREYYPAFMDDMTSAFCHTPTSGNLSTNVNQKSPTIPNIILTDVDSSKSDLSKELANDFVIAFDSLIDANSLQLNPDDFLLHETDLPDGSNFCDDAFAIDS